MLFCDYLIQFLHQKNDSILFLTPHISNPMRIKNGDNLRKKAKHSSVAPKIYKIIYPEITRK